MPLGNGFNNDNSDGPFKKDPIVSLRHATYNTATTLRRGGEVRMNLFDETTPKPLKQLLRAIDACEAPLPDFHRDFVWEPVPYPQYPLALCLSGKGIMLVYSKPAI